METDPTAASQGQPVQGRMSKRSVVVAGVSILGLQETDRLVQAGGSICKGRWVLGGKLRSIPGKPKQTVSRLSWLVLSIQHYAARG